MQGNLFGGGGGGEGDESSKKRRRELEGAVADMLREREALKSQLDALAREREHLEDAARARPPPRTPQGGHRESDRRDRDGDGRSDARREGYMPPPQSRIWLATLRLGGEQKLSEVLLEARRPASPPPKKPSTREKKRAQVLPAIQPSDDPADDVRRFQGFDVIAVALQELGEVSVAEAADLLQSQRGARRPPSLFFFIARESNKAPLGSRATRRRGGLRSPSPSPSLTTRARRSSSSRARARSTATAPRRSGRATRAAPDARRTACCGRGRASASCPAPSATDSTSTSGTRKSRPSSRRRPAATPRRCSTSPAAPRTPSSSATSATASRRRASTRTRRRRATPSRPRSPTATGPASSAAPASPRLLPPPNLSRTPLLSQVAGDELKRERGLKRVFAGWETATPRFAPTAGLAAFDGAAYRADGADGAPRWSERVLWTSLPGLRDRLRLELHDARPTGGERDAVVAAFSASPPPRRPGRPDPVDVGFANLRATLHLDGVETLDDARAAAAALGPCYVAVGDGAPDDGRPRATSAKAFVEDAESLEPPPEPSARALWDDDDPLLARVVARADPDDDAHHLIFRVLERDEPELVAAAILPGRALAQRLLDAGPDGLVDFEEPLLLHGTLRGVLRGTAVLARRDPPSTPSADAHRAAPPPPPDTATPKGKSVTKSVAKGIGNMLGLRKKK